MSSYDIFGKKEQMMLIFKVNFDIFQKKKSRCNLDFLLQYFYHWN